MLFTLLVGVFAHDRAALVVDARGALLEQQLRTAESSKFIFGNSFCGGTTWGDSYDVEACGVCTTSCNRLKPEIAQNDGVQHIAYDLEPAMCTQECNKHADCTAVSLTSNAARAVLGLAAVSEPCVLHMGNFAPDGGLPFEEENTATAKCTALKAQEERGSTQMCAIKKTLNDPSKLQLVKLGTGACQRYDSDGELEPWKQIHRREQRGGTYDVYKGLETWCADECRNDNECRSFTIGLLGSSSSGNQCVNARAMCQMYKWKASAAKSDRESAIKALCDRNDDGICTSGPVGDSSGCTWFVDVNGTSNDMPTTCFVKDRIGTPLRSFSRAPGLCIADHNQHNEAQSPPELRGETFTSARDCQLACENAGIKTDGAPVCTGGSYGHTTATAESKSFCKLYEDVSVTDGTTKFLADDVDMCGKDTQCKGSACACNDDDIQNGVPSVAFSSSDPHCCDSCKNCMAAYATTGCFSHSEV